MYTVQLDTCMYVLVCMYVYIMYTVQLDMYVCTCMYIYYVYCTTIHVF